MKHTFNASHFVAFRAKLYNERIKSQKEKQKEEEEKMLLIPLKPKIAEDVIQEVKEDEKTESDNERPGNEADAAAAVSRPADNQAGDTVGLENQRPTENNEQSNQKNDDGLRE